jgi:hypothetical protein
MRAELVAQALAMKLITADELEEFLAGDPVTVADTTRTPADVDVGGEPDVPGFVEVVSAPNTTVELDSFSPAPGDVEIADWDPPPPPHLRGPRHRRGDRGLQSICRGPLPAWIAPGPIPPPPKTKEPTP